MNLGEKLKEIRKDNHLTQDELSMLFTKKFNANINKGMISKWENGVVEPTNSYLALYAKAFSINMNYLIGISNNRFVDEQTNINPSFRRISVYSKIPAGVPIEAIDEVVDFEDISFKDDIFNVNKDYLGLVVSGDSMYPKYLEGDIIIVEVTPQPESGEDCVVYVNGYEATLKKIIFNENSITLEPLNPSYPPVTYAEGDDPVTILGRVVQIRRNV